VVFKNKLSLKQKQPLILLSKPALNDTAARETCRDSKSTAFIVKKVVTILKYLVRKIDIIEMR
jgi:hypothetical protein